MAQPHMLLGWDAIHVGPYSVGWGLGTQFIEKWGLGQILAQALGGLAGMHHQPLPRAMIKCMHGVQSPPPILAHAESSQMVSLA